MSATGITRHAPPLQPFARNLARISPAAHELRRGLVWCITAGHPGLDRLNNTHAALVSAADNNLTAPTPYGRAAESTTIASSAGFSWPRPPSFDTITIEHTIIWFGEVDNGSAFAAFFYVPDHSSHNDPWADLNLGRSSSTTSLSFGFSHGGSGTFTDSVSDAGMWATGEGPTMYAATRKGTASTFYKNGLQYGARKTFGNNNAVGHGGSGAREPHIHQANREAPQANSVDGRYFFAGIWNRALTATEIALVYRDPFGMFRPWRPLTAGGATTHVLTGTLALTLALDAPLEVRRTLAGTLPLTLALGGPIEVQRGLAGTLPLALAPSGAVEVRRAFAGTLPLALQLSGAPAGGPLAIGDVVVSDAARGGLAAGDAPLGGIGLGDTVANGALEVSDG